MNLLHVNIDDGEREARPVVLSVRGDIDMASGPEFEAALSQGIQRAAEVPSRCLVIDLSEVAFFASAGAAALAKADMDAGATGVELRVVAIGVVRRVLHLTHMESIFDMHETVESALEG